MKKAVTIAISLIIVMFFFGCTTKLKIANETSYTLDLISWIDDSGKVYWFGRDWVYDYVLDMYIQGMYPGSSDEKSVGPGSCPVYFWFASGGPEYHTVEVVVVEKWKSETFILRDDTIVVSAGVSSQSLRHMMETFEKTSSEDELRRLKKYNNM